MANWGKLTSTSGNLYFSDTSLKLLDDRYQNLKSTDHVLGYTSKNYYADTEFLKNSFLDNYEYIFVTETEIRYTFSDSSSKNYSDINIYGGNISDNLFELEIIKNIPNNDKNNWPNINIYEVFSDESGIFSFFIDSSDNISYFDFYRC